MMKNLARARKRKLWKRKLLDSLLVQNKENISAAAKSAVAGGQRRPSGHFGGGLGSAVFQRNLNEAT